MGWEVSSDPPSPLPSLLCSGLEHAGPPPGTRRRSRRCGSCSGSIRRQKVRGNCGGQGMVGTLLAAPPAAPTPTGQDIIASILAELPGRTRRQVVQQLVRMGLASSARDFPRPRWG